MILNFNYNVDVKDGTGLPTYNQQLLDHTKDFPFYHININTLENIEPALFNVEDNVIRFDCPGFYNCYYLQLEEVIGHILHEKAIKVIILHDYVMYEYIEKYLPIIKEKGMQILFFCHMLHRGYMDRITKMHFYEKAANILQPLLTGTAMNAHKEFRAILNSDVIVSNSIFSDREIKKYFEEYSAIYQKRMIINELGIDKIVYKYSPNNETNKVLYFGRIDHQKGIEYLLRDIKLNREKYLKNPLIVAGEGQDNSLMLRIYKAYKEGLIDYRENLNKKELKDLLKEVKYCVFPSVYEPWGLALNEALAMGKICIVSEQSSGMLEQIKKEWENGFTFDFNYSLVKLIEELENEYDLGIFTKISENARKYAFESEKHFFRLKALLRRMLEGGVNVSANQ